MNAPAPPTLLRNAQELLAAVESLHPLPSTDGADPRADTLLLLRTKAIFELESGLDLPVFVGIQGGTNVGKSMIFNALAGKILSPSMVVASATKHPLIFVHENWRSRLLGPKSIPGLECHELSDAKELITGADRTDILYVRFHDDSRLAGVALIDSPDFDGALVSNAEGAARIAVISDVTVFVATEQKYRDRALVDQLRRLLDLKEEVIVIFNRVEEPIVLETIFDDLRGTVGKAGERLRAVRVPPAKGKYPEDEMRESLWREVLEALLAIDHPRAKLAVLLRTLRKTIELARALVARYSSEAGLRDEIEEMAKEGVEECRRVYRQGFKLALPEETLAIRSVLRATELGPRLALSRAVESSSKALSLVGTALRRVGDTTRRLLVRFTRSDEGVIDSESAAIEEYSRARNQADTESVLRLVEPLRIRIESLVRGREDRSALARELLRTFFTPQGAAGFAAAVREAHAETLKAATGSGEDVLLEVETWMRANPGKTRALGFTAIAFKLAAGLALAWALPPAGGAFSILQPLKWIYFGAGYLIAAYVVALIVSFKIRRRKRFQKAREAGFDATLRKTLLDPLCRALDQLLCDKNLDRILGVSREIEASLSQGTGSNPLRPKG